MRAVIYARFSSNLQSDASIDDQVRICRQRAAAEGWSVEDIYTDYAISGAVRERPGLNSMLDRVAGGGIEIVLSESIDRLSRDQEDIAGIFKRVVHRGVRIVTTSEGEIGELHIGLKGTMAALYRKDMADKVRRGLAGRALAGANPGGMAYGYRRVVKLDANGELVRGLREIDPDQAEIVRRIFREILAGDSPKKIAERLNREGVPSPSGREWSSASINGDPKRKNGILYNDLYVGRVVYNKTRRVYHPVTRKREIQLRPQEQWITLDAPELQIVSEADWNAVRDLRDSLAGVRPEYQRRPKKLLSGLTFCGTCGGSWILRGPDRWGCGRHKSKGTCTNGRTTTTKILEQEVFRGFREQLLDPKLVSIYFKEWHEARLARTRKAAKDRAGLERKLTTLDAKVKRLVAAVADGGDEFIEIRDALRQARAERDELRAELSEIDTGSVIELHPGIADEYYRQVEEWTAAFESGDEEAQRFAFHKIRSLIDRVVVYPAPEGRGTVIEFEGRLKAILGLATGQAPQMWVSAGAA